MQRDGKLWVGVTDFDWYELLAAQESLEEVNFWQPSASKAFKTLQPGELFLFKLHSPRNFIVGGGVFAHYSRMNVSLAWEAFEIANGARNLSEMRTRIERYRKTPSDRFADYEIGCILLQQPFFFPETRWIPVPEDWKPNIVQGKSYELTSQLGQRLFQHVQGAAKLSIGEPAVAGERYGKPVMVTRRLGQGSFKILVTDAYERRCAVTNERTLPALEAAHIKPYSESGEHRIDNGLLLRRDLHAIFDRGYITVTPDLHLLVSERIREEFENGRDYYAMQGRLLRKPADVRLQPAPEFLRWHNENRFMG